MTDGRRRVYLPVSWFVLEEVRQQQTYYQEVVFTCVDMQTFQHQAGNCCVCKHNLISGFSHLHCVQHHLWSASVGCHHSVNIFFHVSEQCHKFAKGGFNFAVFFSLPCVCHVSAKNRFQRLNALLRSLHVSAFYLILNCNIHPLLFSLYNQSRTS